MSLYLKINIASLLIPFIFSFHPKIGYYKMWRYSVPAMVLSAIPYIIWDEIFTQQGVWGFNPQYLSGIYISSLPLEEVLFFICIPYASVFTHFTLTKLLPNLRLKQTITYLISYLIIATLISLAILFSDRAYTMVNAVLTTTVLLIVLVSRPQLLSLFYLTFVVIMVPFFIVNGLLTGSCITDEIVWYNNNETMGIRFFTIPAEDVFYAFSLLLLNILLTHLLTTVKLFRRT